MVIAGVVLSATAVAVLARLLQRAGELDLADDIGVALDANWSDMQLASYEEDLVLTVLHDCPISLQPLRDALLANARQRGEV